MNEQFVAAGVVCTWCAFHYRIYRLFHAILKVAPNGAPMLTLHDLTHQTSPKLCGICQIDRLPEIARLRY